jgi:putative peptidoglycan binding protein
MSKLLQIGHSTAAEIHDEFGHIACTLGGINYESRGGKGVIRGSAARGAANPLFRKQYFLLLTEAQGAAARTYADACVGQPYVLGDVPSATRGGDCSGYMSGIICSATGMRVKRLFSTANWRDVRAGLGFKEGLGGGMGPGTGRFAMDRPYPGIVFQAGSPVSDHVRFIQSRLNAAGAAHPPLHGTGQYGPRTTAAVKEFQRKHGLEDDGAVGRDTWRALNAVR